MSSTSEHKFNIAVDLLILILSSVGICSSLSIFCFIFYHIIKRKNSPSRVALLLTANVYFSLTINCFLYIEQFSHVLIFHTYSIDSLTNGFTCQLRAYLQFVAYCSVFYSNALQSVYRLCRVVYHTKSLLQSFKLYRILIIIQWFLCFLFALVIVLLGYFQFLVDYRICIYDLANFPQVCLIGFIAYAIPMNFTIGCYYYTLRSVRQNSNGLLQTMTHVQLAGARRDLVVHFRICVLLGLLMICVIPAFISVNTNLIFHYLLWWSYDIHWAFFILTMTTVSWVLLLISPHVRRLWKQDRVDPLHTMMNPCTIRTN